MNSPPPPPRWGGSIKLVVAENKAWKKLRGRGEKGWEKGRGKGKGKRKGKREEKRKGKGKAREREGRLDFSLGKGFILGKKIKGGRREGKG